MNKNIKYLLFGFLTLIVLCLAIFNFFQNNIYNYFISYNIEKNLYTQEFNKEEIVVFTIGTGSPMTAQKASSGIGIFVNEKFFIFDVGDGVVKKAENMNLPLAELDGIFLTHYHSDHFIDLPYLINRSWVLGRDHDLNVYGPTGLDEIMNSNTSFLKLENQYRVDHHGSEIMDIKYAHGKINEFAEKNNQIIYNKDKIKITAFKVNHSPVSPAVGYMIEYDGKKIVISGDTKINENVFKMAENADLLIHEVILNSLLKRTATILDQKLLTRNSHIITDIQDYHTPPKEIVKQANKANVKALVLTHLVPYPDNLIIKSLYKKEIKGFDGKVYLANDGDKFIIK
jgi:ribonuclease Z